MSAPRILFYVQHLLGIGHLARASRICAACVAAGLDVRMIVGGTPVEGFPGPGVAVIALPPVSSDVSFATLTDGHGRAIDDQYRAVRRDLLLKALDETRPDVVVIEAYPFGRRQMRFELSPFIEAIGRSSPRPALATSIRDLLQERTRPGRNEETVAILNRFFDLVMVHGDPAFASLDETFPLAGAIRTRIDYTGLVTAPAAEPSGERYDVVVSAGGGAAGSRLVHAAIGAARALPGALDWCVVTGPNLPQEDHDALQAGRPGNVRLFRFREDFRALLGACRLSVSQAGYNTTGDVLRAGCRALYVPFAAGGETEQTARAERLRRLGLASWIAEDDLTPAGLAAAIASALSAPPPRPGGLRLDGAERSAALLAELARIRRSRSA